VLNQSQIQDWLSGIMGHSVGNSVYG